MSAPNTSGGLRVPAEWEPHEGTVMCWPSRDSIWGSHREQALRDQSAVAAAVARFEPVTMIAPARLADEAAAHCSGAITLVELPIDDSWARDSGPIYAFDGTGSRVVVDVTFNGWGHKFEPYADDALLAGRWAGVRGEPVANESMVLEGGAVSVDGRGTVLTTEQCLLHPNRNPHLSRADIEAGLDRVLGAGTVVWMPFGLVLDDDTDGHVDNVACFTEPGRVLLQGCDNRAEADHHRLEINARCVRGALDADGVPIEVQQVPVLPFTELDGERLAVPYLNLYVCNGGVIVPVIGHAADCEMLAVIGDSFPGREVVPVPGAVLALGGGGPHCITQQIPANPGSAERSGRSEATTGLG